MSEVEDLIIEHFSAGDMMQLATVRAGKPWCCTVYYATDEDKNIYWISTADRRHSKNIDDNPNVSVAIPIRYKYGEKIIGMSIEGRAEHTAIGKESREGIKVYVERYDLGDKFVEDFVAGKNKHDLFVLRPDSIKLLDAVNLPEGSDLQEWSLRS